MKAVRLRGYGDVDQLLYEDVPQPRPGPGEALVKVEGAGINPVDLKTRRGDMRAVMPLDLPWIPGYDVAGVIAETGPGADGRKAGERVMGLVEHTYAEFLVCRASLLRPIPEAIKTEDAAAFPLALATGSQLIEKGVQPRTGDVVLIMGAAGSVGRVAVYVARQHGAVVIAGVRGSQKQEASALGAERVLAIDDEEEIARLGQVDAIADTVGGSVIGRLLPRLRKGGTLGTVTGRPAAAEGLDIRVHEVWSSPDPGRMEALARDLAAGGFTIPIRRLLPLSEAREGHRLAGQGGGRIILTP